MQPHQPDSPTSAPLVPGFMRGRNQIIFIQPGPDMLLGRELEIIKLQLDPLASNPQIRFNFRQAPFKFWIEVLNNRLTLRPFVDILYQGSLNPHRFALALAADFSFINAVAAFPQYSPEFTKALKQHCQIAVLYIFAGSQAHAFQLRGGDFADARDLRQRQRFDKLRYLVRRNDKLAVRFIQIRGDFCQKFYRRNAGRSSQIELAMDGLTDLLRHQRC